MTQFPQLRHIRHKQVGMILSAHAFFARGNVRVECRMKPRQKASQGRDCRAVTLLESVTLNPREDLKHPLRAREPTRPIGAAQRMRHWQAVLSQAPERCVIETNQPLGGELRGAGSDYKTSFRN